MISVAQRVGEAGCDPVLFPLGRGDECVVLSLPGVVKAIKCAKSLITYALLAALSVNTAEYLRNRQGDWYRDKSHMR